MLQITYEQTTRKIKNQVNLAKEKNHQSLRSLLLYKQGDQKVNKRIFLSSIKEILKRAINVNKSIVSREEQ